MYITIPGYESGMGSSKSAWRASQGQYADIHNKKSEFPRKIQALQGKVSQLLQAVDQVISLEKQAADAVYTPSDPFSFSFGTFAAESEAEGIKAEIQGYSQELNTLSADLRSIGHTGTGNLASDNMDPAHNSRPDYAGKDPEALGRAIELTQTVADGITKIDQNLAKYQSKITALGRAAAAQQAQAQAEQRRQQDALRAQEEAVRRQEEARIRQEQAAYAAEQRRMQAEIDAENRRVQAELAREQAILNAQMQREQAQLQAEAARENARVQAELQRQQQLMAVEQQKAAMEAQLAQQRAALEQQKLQAELAAQYPDVYGPQAQAAQYQQPAVQMPNYTMYMPSTTQIMSTGYDGGGTYANLPGDWMNQAVPPQVLPAPTSSLPANWMVQESQSVQAQQSDWWNPGGSNEMFGMGGMGETTAAGDLIRNIFSPDNVAVAQDIGHAVAPKYVPARVDPEAERLREEEAAKSRVVNTVLTLGAVAAAVWVGSKVLKR